MDNPFDIFATEYEGWFIENKILFRSVRSERQGYKLSRSQKFITE
jgi:hypothetical protein